jgi:Rha family phage regulatory protein
VLKAIRNLERFDDKDQRTFAPMSYEDVYGRTQRMYHMNRDGFVMLAMGFTGEKAHKWKKAYITQFNKMEEALRSGVLPDPEWHQARIQGKTARRTLTDTIRDVLIPYAISQGSKSAERYYEAYTKMINATLVEPHGIKLKAGDTVRNYMSSGDLLILEKAELQMSETIQVEVDRGTFYKDIYQLIKVWCQGLSKYLRLKALPSGPGLLV